MFNKGNNNFKLRTICSDKPLKEILKVKYKNVIATIITHNVWHNYLYLSQSSTLQLCSELWYHSTKTSNV